MTPPSATKVPPPNATDHAWLIDLRDDIRHYQLHGTSEDLATLDPALRGFFCDSSDKIIHVSNIHHLTPLWEALKTIFPSTQFPPKEKKEELAGNSMGIHSS